MSDGSEKPVFKIGLWDYVNEVPPPFGHAMHEFFEFDPGYINLNHGQCYTSLRSLADLYP